MINKLIIAISKNKERYFFAATYQREVKKIYLSGVIPKKYQDDKELWVLSTLLNSIFPVLKNKKRNSVPIEIVTNTYLSQLGELIYEEYTNQEVYTNKVKGFPLDWYSTGTVLEPFYKRYRVQFKFSANTKKELIGLLNGVVEADIVYKTKVNISEVFSRVQELLK